MKEKKLFVEGIKNVMDLGIIKKLLNEKQKETVNNVINNNNIIAHLVSDELGEQFMSKIHKDLTFSSNVVNGLNGMISYLNSYEDNITSKLNLHDNGTKFLTFKEVNSIIEFIKIVILLKGHYNKIIVEYLINDIMKQMKENNIQLNVNDTELFKLKYSADAELDKMDPKEIKSIVSNYILPEDIHDIQVIEEIDNKNVMFINCNIPMNITKENGRTDIHFNKEVGREIDIDSLRFFRLI